MYRSNKQEQFPYSLKNNTFYSVVSISKLLNSDSRKDELPPLSNAQNRVPKVITRENMQDSVDLLDKNTNTDTSVSLEVDILSLHNDEFGASTVGSRDDKEDNAELLEDKTIGAKSKVGTPNQRNDVNMEPTVRSRDDTEENTKLFEAETIGPKEKQYTPKVHFESGDSGYCSEGVSPPDVSISTEV